MDASIRRKRERKRYRTRDAHLERPDVSANGLSIAIG